LQKTLLAECEKKISAILAVIFAIKNFISQTYIYTFAIIEPTCTTFEKQKKIIKITFNFLRGSWDPVSIIVL